MLYASESISLHRLVDMKKIAVIIASILLGGMVICLIVFKTFTDNSIYSDMGIADSYDGFEIEKVFDNHKGSPANGEALYKITKDSNTKADFSDWKKLPIDKRIVEFYITKRYDHVSSEIRKLAEISEGYWKIVGKNPIEGEGMKGLYGNMKLYIYDSQHDLIYCYVFDS